MAHKQSDRIKDSSTTTGTGDFTVSGTAAATYETLSAFLSAADTFYYVIEHGTANEWEVGLGTYSGANVFVRTTVLASSNSDTLVTFSAGTKSVMNVLPAATGNFLVSPAGLAVADDAYAAGWNGSVQVPTKNAVYDKIELILGTTLPAAYQPLDADLTSWAGVTRAAGFDTFAATPSSANLRTLLTDETGTGIAYFVGGALGTPSSGTLTNCTGLPSILAANEATDTTCFPCFFTAATGELGPKTNASLTFNSNTGALGSTTFVGNLTGNVTGNITGALTGNADSVTWANEASDTTCFIGFGTAASGSLPLKSNTNMTFNASTGVATFGQTVVGSISGNAATVTVADAAADTTTWPMLATTQTGNMAPATDAGLTYNASTNVLTATSFTGNVTGNVTGDVTGNVSGNAGTLTWANEAADTTCFIGFVTAASGSLPGKTNANMTFNSSTGAVTFGADVLLTSMGSTSTSAATKGYVDALAGVSGQATASFGAFPGAPETTVVVTGQANINATTSVVIAWVYPKATSDHSEDEHRYDAPLVTVGALSTGVGFTIYVRAKPAEYGNISVLGQSAPVANSTLPYGDWTIAWAWT